MNTFCKVRKEQVHSKGWNVNKAYTRKDKNIKNWGQDKTTIRNKGEMKGITDIKDKELRGDEEQEKVLYV